MGLVILNCGKANQDSMITDRPKGGVSHFRILISFDEDGKSKSI